MIELFIYIKHLFSPIRGILRSKLKWMLCAFMLWFYRVEYIPADGGGLAKLLQVVTLGIMLLFLIRYSRRRLMYPLTTSFMPLRFLTILYLWATISFIWSPMPGFAFFLGFQNVVLLLVFYWILTSQPDKLSAERVFLQSFLLIAVTNSLLYRVLLEHSLFVHHLGDASSCALLLTYSFGELISMKTRNPQRKKMLIYTCIVSSIILVLGTSSGANASAIFGITVALFFSKKHFYAILIMFFGLFLYFNQDLINTIILTIMPGKSLEVIETATGRERLWEAMLFLADQRPFTGWGFGCVERVAWEQGLLPFPVPDAHSNFIGIYGSLGIIGCIFYGLHLVSFLGASFKRRQNFGHLGILAAACCGTLNGYSYGFLVSKACSITLVYLSLVVLQYCFIKKKMYVGKDA